MRHTSPSAKPGLMPLPPSESDGAMKPHSQPFLTREQERTASVDLLVMSHSRLVAKEARAFARYGVDYEDLMQEGMIGLLIAASKFDPDSGNRFSTYARHWVWSLMREYVLGAHSVVHPGKSSQRKTEFFRKRPHHDTSTETPVGDDGLTIGDTLVSTDDLPDEVVERVLDGEAMSARLNDAISSLTEREADVIRSRFLREVKEGLEEIGIRHGVSKERIRQIEVKALEKIKKRIRA